MVGTTYKEYITFIKSYSKYHEVDIHKDIVNKVLYIFEYLHLKNISINDFPKIFYIDENVISLSWIRDDDRVYYLKIVKNKIHFTRNYKHNLDNSEEDVIFTYVLEDYNLIDFHKIDIVINTLQLKKSMYGILFEKISKFSDNAPDSDIKMDMVYIKHKALSLLNYIELNKRETHYPKITLNRKNREDLSIIFTLVDSSTITLYDDKIIINNKKNDPITLDYKLEEDSSNIYIIPFVQLHQYVSF